MWRSHMALFGPATWLVRFCAVSLIAGAHATNWALLASGSQGWENYRHQADLCHVYQVLVANGLNPENIITFSFDDAPHHPKNPFPGKLFNGPDESGIGDDVRQGCQIDYAGNDVTSDNYISALVGNTKTSQRVLNSTEEDNVFLFYVDHGREGLLEFPNPNDVLTVQRFQEALHHMHKDHRYAKMVIYIEACHSGSMLESLPDNVNVLGVSSVGPKVNSLATYCGPEAVVNGTNMGTCLGDLFTVYWLDAVERATHETTFEMLYEQVRSDVGRIARLHFQEEDSQQYGDVQRAADIKVSEILSVGNSAQRLRSQRPLVEPTTVVPAPQASPLTTKLLQTPRVAASRHSWRQSLHPMVGFLHRSDTAAARFL